MFQIPARHEHQVQKGQEGKEKRGRKGEGRGEKRRRSSRVNKIFSCIFSFILFVYKYVEFN